jgi:hypothetical protein
MRIIAHECFLRVSQTSFHRKTFELHLHFQSSSSSPHLFEHNKRMKTGCTIENLSWRRVENIFELRSEWNQSKMVALYVQKDWCTLHTYITTRKKILVAHLFSWCAPLLTTSSDAPCMLYSGDALVGASLVSATHKWAGCATTLL